MSMIAGSRFQILIAEDEHDIRELIALHLGREGYAVTEVADGQEAMRRMERERFDLFIVDWMLPEASGLEVVRQVRSRPETRTTPVLMVTARIEATDIVLGLEAGADDYVTKPFEIPVLLARVRALLRRSRIDALMTEGDLERSREQLRFGDLLVDLAAHLATLEGKPLSLTPSEFRLLAALLQNRGRVLTRQRLITLVQGADVAVVDRAIDTHIFTLRKKLGGYDQMIDTVRGVGYRIREEIRGDDAKGELSAS